jgi:Holliday junction resolvase RusA-like endonuclease|tara:strand:+ start:731 stop:1108 length:378 start_codon:yes stop_codon:yes gene_type:complete
VEITLKIQPISASRPRVTRWGVYYGKRYTAFRKEAVGVVSGIESPPDSPLPLSGPLKVSVMFNVRRPKTSKLDYPNPDIDNYLKAVLDILNGHVWCDDRQIVDISGSKRWAKDEPSIVLKVEPME